VWWQPSTNGQAFTKGVKRAVDSDLGEVFDRISDSFYALNKELCFRYLNDTAADLFGLDEAAIGSDIRDENLTETYENALYEALETQEAVVFEDYYPPWDKWFLNAIYPSESGLSVYSRDITERKRREQELSRYETIVETSPIGITIVDSDGEMQFANDRAEGRFTVGAKTRSTTSALTIPSGPKSTLTANHSRMTRSRSRKLWSPRTRVRSCQWNIQPGWRTSLDLSINGAPVYDDHGEIESAVFAIENITERGARAGTQ